MQVKSSSRSHLELLSSWTHCQVQYKEDLGQTLWKIQKCLLLGNYRLLQSPLAISTTVTSNNSSIFICILCSWILLPYCPSFQQDAEWLQKFQLRCTAPVHRATEIKTTPHSCPLQFAPTLVLTGSRTFSESISIKLKFNGIGIHYEYWVAYFHTNTICTITHLSSTKQVSPTHVKILINLT